MSQETKQPVEQPKDESLRKGHKKEKLHKLHEQMDKLAAEKDELFARLQRLGADYVNYQRRSAKQISESVAYEKEMIIKSFLPVLDNFEHTLSGAENTEDMESFHKGVKIIYDQMLSILKNHGVEQVDSVGQKFDPSHHQAMIQETDADKEDGIILKELQKGYRVGEKILRPGKVVVNKTSAGGEDLPQQSQAVEDDDKDYSDEDRQ